MTTEDICCLPSVHIHGAERPSDYFNYTASLSSYSLLHRYCLEKRKEDQANLVAYANAVTDIWKELSTWKDRTPTLRPELTAASRSDEWTDELRGHPEQRWLYREYSLSIDIEKVQPPTIECVDELTLGVRGRHIHPLTMRSMILTCPNLRVLDLGLSPDHARNASLRAGDRVCKC
ncbi:uncharacterized protein BDV17DRAFT_286581 [Aspergillus undulatus]|uniref:uncharacterized protein n=1 Tax=Aspergillus undulatus TaxID=1810928 RepID=UPI003CCE3069